MPSLAMLRQRTGSASPEYYAARIAPVGLTPRIGCRDTRTSRHVTSDDARQIVGMAKTAKSWRDTPVLRGRRHSPFVSLRFRSDFDFAVLFFFFFFVFGTNST